MEQAIDFDLLVEVHNAILDYVRDDPYSFEWTLNTFQKSDQGHGLVTRYMIYLFRVELSCLHHCVLEYHVEV